MGRGLLWNVCRGLRGQAVLGPTGKGDAEARPSSYTASCVGHSSGQSQPCRASDVGCSCNNCGLRDGITSSSSSKPQCTSSSHGTWCQQGPCSRGQRRPLRSNAEQLEEADGQHADIMGSGVSAGLTAGLSQSSTEDLKALLQDLPLESRKRLAAALETSATPEEEYFVPDQRHYALLLLKSDGSFVYRINRKFPLDHEGNPRGTYTREGNLATLVPTAGKTFAVELTSEPHPKGKSTHPMVKLPPEAEDEWLNPDYEE